MSTTVSTWTYNHGLCGGNFTSANGILTSPYYPEEYPLNYNCTYIISLPTGTYVNVKFIEFHLVTFYADPHSHTYVDSGQPEGRMGYDNLEIRDGNSEASPCIGRYYGYDLMDTIQSTQNNMWIR